ncbi:ABC transporter permease [Nocardioides conyzicola]|uniref:ABC transporter permease n=1 Tax=Nocardioides conyzicola TaxID=1651781 RepID=A0ABP8XUR1_9ACTN
MSPIAILTVWQLLCTGGVIDPRTMASPAQIASTALDLIQDGTLGTETLISLQRVLLGLAIGGSIGILLAVIAGLSRIGDDAIDPPMQALRTLPHLGLISLFITWFGLGELPKVTLIALGACFPLYLNTLGGIRGIDRKVLEAARSMHLTRRQQVRHVVLPGALPQTLVGLRQSLGIAWLSVIVAETVGADTGIGAMINQARDFNQTDVIVVGLAVYAVLGLTTDAIVRYLERKALAWRA